MRTALYCTWRQCAIYLVHTVERGCDIKHLILKAIRNLQIKVNAPRSPDICLHCTVVSEQ